MNRLISKPQISTPAAGDVVYVDGVSGVRGLLAAGLLLGSGNMGAVQLSNPTEGHLLVFREEANAWSNYHQSLITDGGNF